MVLEVKGYFVLQMIFNQKDTELNDISRIMHRELRHETLRYHKYNDFLGFRIAVYPEFIEEL